jgi:hypothetical protein
VIIRIQGEAIPAVEDSEVVILVGKITGDSSWIMLGQRNNKLRKMLNLHLV